MPKKERMFWNHAHIFYKFLKQGKGPRKAWHLTKRYFDMQKFREKFPVVSAQETFRHTKPKKTETEQELEICLQEMLESPHLQGAAARASNELKTNDWRRQRELIDVGIYDFTHAITAERHGGYRFFEVLYELIWNPSTMGEWLKNNCPAFDKIKKNRQDYLIEEARQNQRGFLLWVLLTDRLRYFKKSAQQELQDTRDPLSAKQRKRKVQYISVLRVLEKAFTNPRNLSYIFIAGEVALDELKPE